MMAFALPVALFSKFYALVSKIYQSIHHRQFPAAVCLCIAAAGFDPAAGCHGQH